MTTELEEQFFKCFGISNCNNCGYKEEDYFINCYYLCENKYPEITAEKLLEMICIINKSKFVKAVYLDDCNYTDLENTIIKKTITIMKNEFLNKKLKDEFKHQIQQLFKD